MVGDPWEGHSTVVRCLDWSLDAREIASGSEDGTVRRWNPNAGRQILPAIETGHSWVYTVRYSPTGDKVASGGMDKVIRVLSKDGELLIEIKGHDRALTSLCWSKDGAHIFSASSDSTIRKWHSNNGEQLAVLRGHTSAVRSLCLSPDERHLVSASKDYSVRIWDLKANQPVGDQLLHDDELWALAVSPDGKWIVSAGLDAKVYVWSLEAVLQQRPGDQVRICIAVVSYFSKLTLGLFRVRMIQTQSAMRSSRQVKSSLLLRTASHFFHRDAQLNVKMFVN
jgi:WD40 repeat protein